MRTPLNERVSPEITSHGSHRKSVEGEAFPESRLALRTCILTGQQFPSARLIRLAISPEGYILPDPNSKAPGRGAWISVPKSDFQVAIQTGKFRAAFLRSFKGLQANFDQDLPEKTEEALKRNLLDRLGLELRAGNLILGASRINECCRKGNANLLLHASDASEDGQKKLDQAWRVGRREVGSGQRGIILPLDREALSVALGRDNVVHLLLVNRLTAERIERSLARLNSYLGDSLITQTNNVASVKDHNLNK
jgi:predicted RNA-binding protein YlxR (DUF448 family)